MGRGNTGGSPLLDPSHRPGPAVDLVPAQPGLILVVDAFCSAEETERLCGAAAISALQPPSAADKQPKKNEAYLDRDTCAFDDPALAAALWARLRPLLPDVGDRTPVGFHGHDGTRSTGMPSAERAAKLVKAMNLEEKLTLFHGSCGGYVGNVCGNTRLGIPNITMNDGPQGFRDNAHAKGFF